MTDGPDAAFDILSDGVDQFGFCFGREVRDVVWLLAAVDAEQREAWFGIGRTRHFDIDLVCLNNEFGHEKSLFLELVKGSR